MRKMTFWVGLALATCLFLVPASALGSVEASWLSGAYAQSGGEYHLNPTHAEVSDLAWADHPTSSMGTYANPAQEVNYSIANLWSTYIIAGTPGTTATLTVSCTLHGGLYAWTDPGAIPSGYYEDLVGTAAVNVWARLLEPTLPTRVTDPAELGHGAGSVRIDNTIGQYESGDYYSDSTLYDDGILDGLGDGFYMGYDTVEFSFDLDAPVGEPFTLDVGMSTNAWQTFVDQYVVCDFRDDTYQFSVSADGLQEYEYVPGEPVPEPATMLLVGGGLLGLAGLRRRLRK